MLVRQLSLKLPKIPDKVPITKDNDWTVLMRKLKNANLIAQKIADSKTGLKAFDTFYNKDRDVKNYPPTSSVGHASYPVKYGSLPERVYEMFYKHTGASGNSEILKLALFNN